MIVTLLYLLWNDSTSLRCPAPPLHHHTSPMSRVKKDIVTSPSILRPNEFIVIVTLFVRVSSQVKNLSADERGDS